MFNALFGVIRFVSLMISLSAVRLFSRPQEAVFINSA